MSRRHLTFTCEGSLLGATIDEAEATTGLLIVSGGNEIRCGPWGSQAQIAARIASQGWPVFRFDRRGVGDSEGANGGFRSSTPDLTAAIAAFQDEAPHVTRVVAFGNCDAASALALFSASKVDALVLANPWTFDESSSEQHARAVVRSHYGRRLKDRHAVRRLLSGQVSWRKLFTGVLSAARPVEPASGLQAELQAALAGATVPVSLLVAERDRTGQTFLAGWLKADPRVRVCPGATHSFVEAHARDWLIEQISAALSAQSTSSAAIA